MNLFHASVGLFRRLPELCSRFSGRRSLFAAVCMLVCFCLSATCSAVMRPVQEPADQPSVEEQPPEPRTLKDESESLDPTNKDALAWYMAGHKALKRGDLKEAADAFEKSAAAAPDSPIPLRARAMVLFRLGRAADGLAAAETAMKMDQDDWQTRLELAVAFFQNRQLGRAVELIEQAVASKSLNRKSLDFIQVHQVRSAIQL
ncbi:MAG: tetratricopeptide repeat protein, partial [Planctomycetaceae bacterium]